MVTFVVLLLFFDVVVRPERHGGNVADGLTQNDGRPRLHVLIVKHVRGGNTSLLLNNSRRLPVVT